ncbi:MAG TPA: tetratricopeptide repeat protein [Flavisolibacter sp.]|jgi:Flp pilus assembly protein TadD|nr:tetratricopeptide repeat protein [Flavisolibacter sp.]
MKKSAIVLFFAAFLSISALAQNVQEGVNNFYAERYQSAKSVFEKLVAANPNNMEATYWLGQTLIAQDNTAGARSLYEKALAANGNAPLILAGMGHVELLEGKQAEARQRFETAITASKGKKGSDPLVLNAIGRANVATFSDTKKVGDIDYAIAKLNEAAQLAPTNPDIFVNLGNAYRKKHDGSQAVQAYRKAGNYAPAIYRTAMLYQTQTQYGQGNWDIVLENLNSALTADPKFAPAYEQLATYNLLYKKDFPTAESFATKLVANSDPGIENTYLPASIKYLQNKFDEAITMGKAIVEQTNNNPRPRVYRLLAYSYMGNKDTATACTYSEQLFAKAKEEDLVTKDYLLHAQSCGKNNPEVINADLQKALSMEPEMANKVAMLNDFIKSAKESNQRVLEGELRLVSYQLRGANANPTELISYIAVPLYLGGAYQKADSVAKAYATIAPDSIYGHYWSALALSRIDTTMSQGLAIPSFEKALAVALTDKVRYKSQGVQSASTLAAYYNNIKEDKAAAIGYLQKGLEFDPTNTTLKSFLDQLSKQPAPRTTPPTRRTNTTTNAAKDTKTKNNPK